MLGRMLRTYAAHARFAWAGKRVPTLGRHGAVRRITVPNSLTCGERVQAAMPGLVT